jgi:hypothetical protein
MLAKCSFAARFCPPGCPRKVDSFARPSLASLRDTQSRRCLGSPRAGSPAATLSDRRLREAILDASGRLMQPTLSKTSTHAPGSQRRSFRQSRWCRRAPRFNDAGLTSASGSRCRTECSRLRAVSLGLGSDASSPTGRRRALERADSDPDDLDRFRHRTIEERWTPWSETPSTGWQLLASSRRSRRAPSARAFRPPAPFHPSRFASG